MVQAIGFAVIVVGVTLSVLGYRLDRRLKAEPHDLHGNPASDPIGCRSIGAIAMLGLGLLLAILFGPILLLVG